MFNQYLSTVPIVMALVLCNRNHCGLRIKGKHRFCVCLREVINGTSYCVDIETLSTWRILWGAIMCVCFLYAKCVS